MLTERELAVRTLRTKGKTQSQVAKALGISQPAVSAFERSAARKITTAEAMLAKLKELGLLVLVLCFGGALAMAFAPGAAAADPNPGHSASSIGPGTNGTFAPGNYTFPNNLNVTQNFTVGGASPVFFVNTSANASSTSENALVVAGGAKFLNTTNGTVFRIQADGSIGYFGDAVERYLNFRTGEWQQSASATIMSRNGYGIDLRSEAGSPTSGVRLSLGGNSQITGAAPARTLVVTTNGTTALFITENTTIGVNTTTPKYALDVTGSVNVSQTLWTPQLCLNGVCQTSWPASSGNISTSNGIAGYVPRYTNATNLDVGAIYDSGAGKVGINLVPNAALEVNGTVQSIINGSLFNRIGTLTHNSGEDNGGGTVIGRYAYHLTSTAPARLVVSDISDPSNPTRMGNLTLQTGEDYPAFAAAGKYLYIATYTNPIKFVVVDISNPRTPVRVANITLAGTSNVQSIAVSGKYVYIGTGEIPAQVIVIDVSNPLSPQRTGSLTLGTTENYGTLAAIGPYAVVATDTNPIQVVIVNATNPHAPTRIGNTTLNAGDTNGYSVLTAGRYAYITTWTTPARIVVVDISNLTNPARAGALTLNSGEDYGRSTIAGRYLYTVLYTTPGRIVVTDISKPETPVRVANYTLSTGENTTTSITVSGRYAYVTTGTAPARLLTIELPGIESGSGSFGTIETGQLQVRQDLRIAGDTSTLGSVSIGNTLRVDGDTGLRNITVTGTLNGTTIVGSTLSATSQICLNGSCQTSWPASSSGNVSANESATNNLTRFSNTTNILPAAISDNGTAIIFGRQLIAQGGNARGTNAIDLQLARATNTQVASGTYSVISGGANNTATGDYSVVSGGQNNTAVTQHSLIVGGRNNYQAAGGTDMAIIGGSTNYASGDYAATISGLFNNASAAVATILNGNRNNASAIYATVLSGVQNVANGSYAVTSGIGTVAQGYNSFVIGSYNTVQGTTGSSVYGDQAFIIGNGTSSARSTAAYITNNGTIWTGGSVITPLLCLNGSCQTSWPTTSGGNVTSSNGTSGYLGRFTNSTNIATGSIYDTGSAVGIGTAVPLTVVHINATTPVLKVQSPDSGSSYLRLTETNDYRGGYLQYRGTDNTFIIGTHDIPDSLTTTDTAAIYLPRGYGFVGINNSNPQYLLDVNGSANVSTILYTPQLCLNGDCRTAWPSGSGLTNSNNSAGNVPRFSNTTNLATGSIYDNGTAVGIGTSTPSTQLHLNGSGAFDVTLLVTNNMSNGLAVGVDDDGGAFFWNTEETEIAIATNNTERVRILADGKIGIGTINPAEEFEFQGERALFNGVMIGENTGGFDTIEARGTSGLILAANDFTSQLVLNMNSQFGVNTTDPRYALDVNGSANISRILYTPQLCLNGVCQTTWPSSGGNVTSSNGTAGYVGRFTNSTNIATGTIYDNGAAVSIGGANQTGTGPLAVKSTGFGPAFSIESSNVPNAFNDQLIVIGEDGNGAGTLQVYDSGGDPQVTILGQQNSSNLNGAVGIGISLPQAELHIAGNKSNDIVSALITNNNTNGAAGISFVSDGPSGGFVGMQSSGWGGNLLLTNWEAGGDIELRTLNGAEIDVQDNGYVDINGNVTIDGGIDLNQFYQTPGTAYYPVLSYGEMEMNGSTSSNFMARSNMVIGYNNATGTGYNRLTAYDSNLYASNDGDDQNLYGVFSEQQTHAGDIGTGLYVGNLYDGSSTGGTLYGIYLNLNDADVTNYGIYQASANTNYFAGRVGVNTTTPYYALDVNGSANISQTLYTPQLCLNGVCQTSWPSSGGSGNVTSSNGTAGYLARFTNSTNTATGLIYDNGTAVGIGTTAPDVRFSVVANPGSYPTIRAANSDYVLNSAGSSIFMRTGATSGNTFSMVQASAGGDTVLANLSLNPYGGDVGIGTTSPTQTLDVRGNVNISGTIYYGGNLTSYGADFAERFTMAEALVPGDVVCFTEDMSVQKCRVRADFAVAGVVASNPTIVGNAGAPNSIPVGIVGIVTTKVRGPVKQFSPLTTSEEAGVAVAATAADAGAIIGKAMQPCDEGLCEIKVLVGLR